MNFVGILFLFLSNYYKILNVVGEKVNTSLIKYENGPKESTIKPYNAQVWRST